MTTTEMELAARDADTDDFADGEQQTGGLVLNAGEVQGDELGTAHPGGASACGHPPD